MSKYSAALLHILFVVLSALTAALDHGLNPATIVQLLILTVGAVVVYFVPLLDVKLAGILKVGASALTAALSALAPLLLQGHITPSQWITIVLAALGAVGVGVGVSARLDGPGKLLNVGAYSVDTRPPAPTIVVATPPGADAAANNHAV